MANITLNVQALEWTLGHFVTFGWPANTTPTDPGDEIRFAWFNNFAVNLSQDYRYGAGGDVNLVSNEVTGSTYPVGGLVMTNPVWSKSGTGWELKGNAQAIAKPAATMNGYRICMWNAASGKGNRVFSMWIPPTPPLDLNADPTGRNYRWDAGISA